MYSISPLPPIDTLHSHDGFVVMILVCLVLWLSICFLYACFFDEETLDKFGIFSASIAALVLVYSGYVSFTTGTITPQKNIQVEGKIVQFVTEGYSTSERVGKQTKDIEHHYSYVVYDVEGNIVLFQTNPGIGWPKTAILYKN